MKILVIGAGIGGLTFIRSLQYLHSVVKNFKCSIWLAERDAVFREGVGIVLHPNGLRILDTIGLSKEIEQFSNAIGSIDVLKNGRHTHIDLQQVWGIHNPTRSILRKDLHTVLAKDIENKPDFPVKVLMGCSVEKILQNEHSISVEFENGTTESFDLVIAADGVQSQARKFFFPEVKAINTHLFYMRFITQCQSKMESSVWNVTERNGVSYGFIPLTENRQHCFVQLQTSVHPFMPGEEEHYIRKSIIQLDPLLSDAWCNRSGSIHSGFAYMVPPGCWNIGNCVLLGDAAHAVSPTLSQGGSLAMEDALALALSLYGKGSIPEAIHLYQQTRNERCMWAYRMAVSQLSSLRKSTSEGTKTHSDPFLATRLMAGMYKPFKTDALCESLLLKFKSVQTTHQFNNLQTN